MKENLNIKKAEIFKALSNPVRLEIIDILSTGEKCVCEIIATLNKYEQPHISKSLTKLKSVGLIEDRKEGLKVFYKLKCNCLKEFIDCLDKIL